MHYYKLLVDDIAAKVFRASLSTNEAREARNATSIRDALNFMLNSDSVYSINAISHRSYMVCDGLDALAPIIQWKSSYEC